MNRTTHKLLVLLANRHTIANGIWTLNGNNVYSNITGKAGIGTTLPDDKLHLFDSVNLRILIETPDDYYAGVRTRNSQREYFMGTIGDRWSVFDNNVGGERISVLPNGNVGIETLHPPHRLTVSILLEIIPYARRERPMGKAQS